MQAWKRNLISVLILFHLVTIPIVGTKPRSRQNAFDRAVMPYLVWARLNQEWRLFVPTPRTNALKYRALIIHQSGKVQTWQRPYPPNWGFFERHLAYQFQKWDLATGRLEQQGLLWKDLADFLTFHFWDKADPPEEIHLIRSSADWPPPKPYGYVMPKEEDLRWTDFTVFKYFVREGTFWP